MTTETIAKPAPETEQATEKAMRDLVGRYFELIYTQDPALFDQVFAPDSALYGVDAGSQLVWPAPSHYRKLMAERPSPKSLNAPREEQILLLDVASDTVALAKVKVRINQNVFIDYLAGQKLAQGWRIVSKTWHRMPPA